jgi:hypothetical protein
MSEEKKKRVNLGKILFKLVTLGGLLLVIFKYFQKQKQEESKEEVKK